MFRIFISIMASIFYCLSLNAQCDTGGEPECQCGSAQVLCSVNELDGFSGQMSTFQHPADGPDDFCGPSVSNNPNWFAFIAWCDDITMDIDFSNCVSAPGSPANGVQVVVFDDCSNLNVIDCDASCNTSGGNATLDLSGLTIGESYYFMIDGCAGAACDYTISVSPTNCDENIEDWTDTSIAGETNVCIDSDEEYNVETLLGATSYHWSIDGNEVDVTNDASNTITWDSEGTYLLCVDVSNICIDISEPPMEICTTVTVADPNAGTLTASPNPLCPGEISTVTVSGHNTNSDYTHTVIVTDPTGIVIDVFDVGSTSIDVTYDACGDIKVYSLNFATTSGIPLPSVGADYSGSDCANTCCDEVCETISFEDTEDPTFTNPPADESLVCTDIIAPMADLLATDNCSDDELVMGIETGSITTCDGGTITREWEYTDDCGNTVIHTQTITATPAEEADFISVPADMTMDCDEFQNFSFPDLMYTNSSTGDCLIEGMVSPSITDNTDDCDGTVEAEWIYTDDCNRTITASQIITINPPLAPVFINLPSDMTITCDNLPPPPSPLEYTNSEVGDCLISGTQDGTVSENFNECGGDITHSWEYTDPCGRLITYDQVYTIDPATEAVFLSLPPDMTMSCEDFNSFTPETLDYSNMESGPCEISGSEDATETGNADGCGGTVSFTWTFQDNCGREIMHMQVITVDPADPAMFLDPPSDMTLDCSEYDITPPSLSYDNEAPGLCQISGDIVAIESGNVSECGGLITYTWTFTDDCGRTTSESQDIEFLPAPEPEFIDPPEDITVACDEDVPDADDLEYSNEEGSICDISGDVTPTINIIDNVYEYTWEFLNTCTGNVLSHTQTIVNNIPIELEQDEFEFTLCLQGTLDLGDIFINDLNGTDISFTFHDRSPPSDNNEIDPVVILDDDELDFYINVTNQYGCEAVVEVLLIANVTDAAGGDAEEEICIDEGPMDVFSFLDSDANLSGEFIQVDGPQDLDIFDPSQVNISDVTPGVYILEYLVDDSGNGCPADMAIIEVEIFAPIDIELISLACNADGMTYTLAITNNDYNIDIDFGTITSETATEVTIDNIPIDQDITIEVQDKDSRCEKEFFFIRPDCDCPMVMAPISNGDTQVCEGSANPAISVTIDAMTIANWYDAPVAGNLLLENSLSYTPTQSAVGIYNFYVEAESTSSVGCVSTTRTEVSLEIIPQPSVSDTLVNICDTADNALIQVERDLLENTIFRNIPNLTANFYVNPVDREANSNEIIFPYTLQQDNQSLYVRVSNSANCQSDIIIDINIQDLPILSAIITDVSCQGLEDGIIEYTVDIQGLPFQVVYRNDTITENIITDLRPDSYTIVAIDSFGCRDTLTEIIEEGLSLDINNLVVQCDNNGTTSDETDDFYTVTFSTENSLSNIGTYDLLIQPFGTSETFTYGEIVNLDLPADGSQVTLTATDSANNCMTDVDLGTLIPCSSDCLLNIENFEYNCDDNGTPTDGTDDMYTFLVSASSINGSTDDTYNIIIDGVVSHNFPYDVTSTFEIAAQSQTVVITLEDSQFNGCSESETILSLDPCSNDCLIEYEIIEIICNNNGTLDDNDDDTYDVSILINGTNTSNSGYVLSSGELGMYGDTITLSGNNISDGVITTIISDAEDSMCNTTMTITPPDPCSQPCTIEFSQFTIIPCDDNGTSTDPQDDFYSISLQLSTINGNTSMYTVEDSEGNSYGPFADDMPVDIGPFSADGSELIITITDLNNTTCFLQETIIQESCSDECILEANILSINCDNNGTDDTDSDDTYSLTISVSGLNVSSMYSIPSLGIMSLYTDNITIDNLLISDGTTTITIQDQDDPDCFSELTVIPPAPCSQPCDIALASLEILPCDDNMTGSVTDDDNYYIDIQISGTLGNGTEYNLRDDQGNIYGPFIYDNISNVGPFLSDGSTITLSLFDITNGSCVLDFDISNMPCSSCPQTMSIDADITILTCDNDLANLSIISSQAIVDISWTSDNGFSDTSENITVDQSGDYTATVTYSDGCTLSQSITIESNDDIPIADAGPDRIINCDTDTITLDATTSINNNTSTAEWTDENGDIISTELTLQVTEAGSYGLRIIDSANLCESVIDIVNISVSISDPSTQIFADPDSIFNCFIEIINLTAADEDNTVYMWLVEDSELEQLTITVSDIDSVTLIALDTITNCQNERTLFIPDLTQFPIIELGPISSIDCISGESCITVTTPSSNPTMYNWYDSNGNLISNEENTLCISEPGDYSIELVDEDNGCTNSEEFTITESIVPEILLPTITTIVNNDQQQLMPIINIDSTSISSIVWTSVSTLSCNDCLTPTIINPIDGDSLTVTITTNEGCIATAITLLTTVTTPEIYVPNIFSPQDRSNFTVFSNDQITTIDRLSIYDRWGNLMFLNENFITNDPDQGWDGTYNDRLVEQGVYVFVFVYELDGRKIVESGDVTLIR